MNKKKSLPIIIISSVVAAILITVVVLMCVSIKPFDAIDDYEYVNFYADANGVRPSIEANEETKAKFDEGMKKTSFSVLHALFEGQVGYGMKFQTEKNEDDKTVRKVIEAKDIKSQTQVSEGVYVLEFVYFLDDSKATKTIKVEGEEVHFNVISFCVSTSNGEIKEVVLYPYNIDLIDAQNPVAEEYSINPVIIKANTTVLFDNLKEILKLQK